MQLRYYHAGVGRTEVLAVRIYLNIRSEGSTQDASPCAKETADSHIFFISFFLFSGSIKTPT
jgi:hypothetical protein